MPSTARSARWRGWSLVPTVLAIGSLSSCRSLDPSPDLDRVSALAQSRIGDAPFEPAAMPSWRGDRPLSVAEAIEIALRNAPDLVAARPTLAIARSTLAEASQPPNPVFRWMVGVPIDSVEAVPFFLGIAQDLGYLLQRDALIAIAELELDAEVLATANRFVEKALEVEALHRRIVAAQAHRAVAADRVRLAESTLELERHREAVGEGTPGATSLGLAEVQHARAREAESQRRLCQAKLALLLAIGRPGLPLDWSATSGTAEAPSASLPLHLASSLDSEDRSIEASLVQAALSSRLDLLASDLATCARFEAIDVAARSIWNSLSFGVGVDRDMEGMRGVPFSGAIPIPIFDDGSVPRARAAAAWELAVAERLALAQAIEGQVRSAWLDRLAALATLEARRVERIEIEHAVTAIRAAYDGGFEPLDAVLELEGRRLAVLADAIDAESALDLSLIELRRSVGGRLEPVAADDPRPTIAADPSAGSEDHS